MKNKLGLMLIRLTFIFFIRLLLKRKSIIFHKDKIGSTNWIDIDRRDDLLSQYKIHWNQSDVIGNPSLQAELILESWIKIDNNYKNSLKPILRNLLRISPLLDNGFKSNQEISKTVYVMY